MGRLARKTQFLEGPLCQRDNWADTRSRRVRAEFEETTQQLLERRINRAKRVIDGAIAIAIPVAGRRATQELLLNAAYDLRDEQQHAELIGTLRAPRR